MRSTLLSSEHPADTSGQHSYAPATPHRLRLPEHFCAETARAFARTLAHAQYTAAVVLDLSQTRSIDASGIMALAVAWKRARAHRQAFLLHGAGDAVAAALIEAGLIRSGAVSHREGGSPAQAGGGHRIARVARTAGAAVALLSAAAALAGCATPSLFWPQSGGGGAVAREARSEPAPDRELLSQRADALAFALAALTPAAERPAFGRAGLAAADRAIDLGRRLLAADMLRDAARVLADAEVLLAAASGAAARRGEVAAPSGSEAAAPLTVTASAAALPWDLGHARPAGGERTEKSATVASAGEERPWRGQLHDPAGICRGACAFA